MIRPYQGGIAFSMNGMHAVEDYIVSRYQMYVQVYFHPVSRGMEVVLEHLLHRAHELYHQDDDSFARYSQLLLPFLDGTFSLDEYLKLDDGVLNTCFSQWTDSSDPILSDLAKRFLNRKPLKSAMFSGDRHSPLIAELTSLVEKVGYNPNYYTAINSSYDLPYDFYRPEEGRHRTQIEILRNDGTLVELSEVSQLVAALAGQEQGDERFFFPKEMVDPTLRNHYDLFDETYQEFARHIHNGALIEEIN